MSNQTTASNVIEKPRARVEEERARRRRRDDMGTGRLNPLAVTGKKDPAYVYRWINDEPGRIHALTQDDDWDVVTADQLGDASARDKGVGTGVERIVERATGKRAVLVRKRKDYYVEDRAKQQSQIDELDAAIRNGSAASPQSLQATDPGKSYVPRGGIVIDDGRRT